VSPQTFVPIGHSHGQPSRKPMRCGDVRSSFRRLKRGASEVYINRVRCFGNRFPFQSLTVLFVEALTMKRIKLTKGYYAIVDDEMFDVLGKYKWHASIKTSGRVCAARQKSVGGKRTTIYMHRQILGTPDGMETDHINRNDLDNRVANLRACTSLQNSWNKGISKRNTSGYKGVTRKKGQKTWYSQIRVDGMVKYLGSFKTKQEAYRAYIEACKKYRGEFVAL